MHPNRPPRSLDSVSTEDRARSRVFLYVWTLVVLAIAAATVILGWHAAGGTADPAALAAAHVQVSRTTAVVNSAILVFREGLETILVLAAVTASFLGANRVYRRPVAAGGAVALLASVGTWFLAIWLIGVVGGQELDVQAATGIPAIVVLLVVMNWFFHRMYWTGWIAHHHKRRRLLLGSAGVESANVRRLMLGFALLGFTSVYREGFEVVLFLQTLRVHFGSSVVLEGVTLGLLATGAVGVLTFGLHQRLPYRRLLVITGAMLCVVLLVMVGEEVNEMQLAGWIGTTAIGVHLPGWMGTWFSIFPNVETIAAQAVAIAVVLGSYFVAEHLRVRRPRARGLVEAVPAQAPPEPPSPQRPSERPLAGRAVG